MNNKKKLIYSIIAVLLIIAIVGGSTYAYFQWTSGEDDRTGVNVTIKAEQVTMHIEPETTVFTNLRPTNNCNNSYAYGDALVTIENHTGAVAIPSFKLSAKITKGGKDALTTEMLSHIHYTVVAIDTNQENGTKGLNVYSDIQSTINGNCSSPLKVSAETNDYFDDNTRVEATGTFATVSTNGEWSDLPSTEGVYLPRQYNSSLDKYSGVTFAGNPHTTTYQYFRVYIWLDNEYIGTTVGNTISDPLQNAKIEVTWSTNSMIEQVAKEG